MNVLRWFAMPGLFVLAGLVLSACGQAARGVAQPPAVPAATPTLSQASATPAPASPEATAPPSAASASGLEPRPDDPRCQRQVAALRIRFSVSGWQTNFCQHSVDYADILSGGPPPDGIPPLDNPKFETAAEADAWLKPNEPVISFRLGDEARAYPLQVLIWHEIVNDAVAGRPVAVTFCPLCNAAIVFDRRVNGQVLRFGTSGNLRFSDLIMWDDRTESWWQQFTGEAIVGDMTGTRLEFLPAQIVAWADFKAAFPQGQVLSRDTGYSRPYGQNPYTGYDRIDRPPFLFDGTLDDRLPPMARVVAVVLGETVTAYPFSTLKEVHVVNDVVEGHPIAVFWKEGTASALDKSSIAASRDVGSTAVYERRLDGQTLTFTWNGAAFQDQETGSTWDLFGQAIAGPLAGKSLKPLLSHEYFWFAWAAFRPDTMIYRSASEY
jgi:hypothetical protein